MKPSKLMRHEQGPLGKTSRIMQSLTLVVLTWELSGVCTLGVAHIHNVQLSKFAAKLMVLLTQIHHLSNFPARVA